METLHRDGKMVSILWLVVNESFVWMRDYPLHAVGMATVGVHHYTENRDAATCLSVFSYSVTRYTHLKLVLSMGESVKYRT